MLYRVKITYSEGPKELRGNWIRPSDFNWPKGDFIHMTSRWRCFEGGESLSCSLPLLGGWAGHQSGDVEQLLGNHLLYTFIYICHYIYMSLYMCVIIIIHFLFFTLVNNFLNPWILLCGVFFNSLPHPTGKEGDQLCGVEPPTRLNHNSIHILTATFFLNFSLDFESTTITSYWTFTLYNGIRLFFKQPIHS